jgi:bifunctional DNA-binding transcriptional regulator/antitoxin component of YhaV-PrlF toxin-antitoxin module
MDEEVKVEEEAGQRIPLRVGSQGRVIIPQSVLSKKGIREGDIVWVSIERAEVK